MIPNFLHRKIRLDVKSDQKIQTSSQRIPVEPKCMYEFRINVKARQGGEKSAYVTIIFIDKYGKELTRRIKYIHDYSNTIKEYVLRSISPLDSSYAIIGYRVNTEGAKPSHVILELPIIEKCKFQKISGTVDESYDEVFDYEEAWNDINLEENFWTIVGPKTKSEYDEMGRYKLKLLLELGLTPNSSILDVGCGTGMITRHLESYLLSPFNYVGTDLSHHAIQYCKKHFPKFEFYQNSLTKLPDINKKFDMIILFSVLTHIYPNEMIDLLKDCKRFLNPSGRIIADVILSSSYKEFSGTRDKIEINEDYFCNMLQANGFKIVKFSGGNNLQSLFIIT